MSRLPAGPDTDPVRANGSKVAVMEHSSRSPGDVLSDDGQLRITRLGDEPWLFVAGEIDEYSYKSLIGYPPALPGIPARFISTSRTWSTATSQALRAFVVLASAPCRDHAGMRVVLHHVPPCLVNVLHILGWDTTTGLTLAGAGKSTDPLGPSGRDRAVTVLLSIRVAWARRRVLPARSSPRAPALNAGLSPAASAPSRPPARIARTSSARPCRSWRGPITWHQAPSGPGAKPQPRCLRALVPVAGG